VAHAVTEPPPRRRGRRRLVCGRGVDNHNAAGRRYRSAGSPGGCGPSPATLPTSLILASGVESRRKPFPGDDRAMITTPTPARPRRSSAVTPSTTVGIRSPTKPPGAVARRREDGARARSIRHRSPVGKGVSTSPIFLDRAAGERNAVARTVRDSEVTILTRRQSFEEIRRRPVDELDQEAVRERADDVK